MSRGNAQAPACLSSQASPSQFLHSYFSLLNYFQIPILKPRLNNLITAPEVRVLDEKGGVLGIMKTSEALQKAYNQGLDLIETVPNANPPIAQIISYDKYRYQKEKERKKERQAQKTADQKRIQISPRAQKNDLLVKLHQLEKFLNEGHPVEVYVRLRGREKYNKDWAKKKLQEFLKMITVEHRVVSDVKIGGNNILVQITDK